LILERLDANVPIGLSVTFEESRGIFQVSAIKPEGLVPGANRERARRGGLPLVEPGDFLVSINGVSGDKQLMAQQLGKKRIQLVFAKDK
jgi:hypothetical protein